MTPRDSSSRRAARDSRFFRRRMLLVTDNMVTACILEKGRSRIPSLNALCKRAFAYQAAMEIQVRVRYLETDRNPADGPSRLMPIGWHEGDAPGPADASAGRASGGFPSGAPARSEDRTSVAPVRDQGGDVVAAVPSPSPQLPGARSTRSLQGPGGAGRRWGAGDHPRAEGVAHSEPTAPRDLAHAEGTALSEPRVSRDRRRRQCIGA